MGYQRREIEDDYAILSHDNIIFMLREGIVLYGMSKTESAPNEISPDEVAARRDDDELFILDVRNKDDYEEWSIEGSYNLPLYDQLLDKDYSGLKSSLDEIPQDKEIAAVCVGGITSGRTADFLNDRGYEAESMTDGMRGWGRVHQGYDVDGVEGVTQIVRPGTGCVSYLVYDGGEAVVVDPSRYVDTYLNAAEERGAEIVGAIDTHAHADHISGGRAIADECDVPYYLHEVDSGSLDQYTPIEDGETIRVGDRELNVVYTPGHTPGSVSLQFGDALLSGDTLFIRSVGRPDLEDSSESAIREASDELFDSLERLADLPNETVVLPGHFSDESMRPLATTLSALKTDNELFGLVEGDAKEEFVETIVESLSDTPANYQEIKHINWGEEPLDDDAEDLELGPNNCAAS